MAMENLGSIQLRTLVNTRKEISVSIYIPRLEENSANSEKLYQQMLENLERRLKPLCTKYFLENFMQPLRTSATKFLNILKHEGLAIFKSPSFEGFYRTHQCHNAKVMISDHFYLRPLLAVLSQEQQYYMAWITRQGAYIFTGNADRLTWLEEWTFDSTFSDDGKSHFRPLLKRLEKDLSQRVRNLPIPVIIAGPKWLTHHYRTLNHHPYLGECSIDESFENLNLEDLHARSWPVASHIFETITDHDLQELQEQESIGQGTHEIQKVISAAQEGRIDRLLVSEEALNPELISYNAPRFQNRDLLDELAQTVLRQRGHITLAPYSRMPEHSSVAAIFKH